MKKDEEISSWIEKRIHERAVKLYENSINEAYNDLKESMVGGLSLKNPPKYWGYKKPLNYADDSYNASKEEIFSTIFEDYDAFKKKEIEYIEQDVTDQVNTMSKEQQIQFLSDTKSLDEQLHVDDE